MARELYVNVRRGLIKTTKPSPKRKEEEEELCCSETSDLYSEGSGFKLGQDSVYPD
jgi:hypothetical protein